MYVTRHIKTGIMSLDIKNDLIGVVQRASIQISNASEVVKISQLL